MNLTCYECGQVGHIWTNCPRLMKVRMVAIRADGTEDPEMDPRKKMNFNLPIKKGREIIVNIKKNNLMYTWSHSINGILRKKRKQEITLFPTEPMQ